MNKSKIKFILSIFLAMSICLYFTSCLTKDKKISVNGVKTPIKSPQIPTKTPKPIKKKTTSITAKGLKAIDSPEEYYATNLPIISAIPEKKIYLYGVKPFGEVLYINDKGHCFNWDYMTPRFVLPVMSLGDFDNDGYEELAVILYVGSGTGYSVEELHIVDITGDEYLENVYTKEGYIMRNPRFFTDHIYKDTDYISQLDKFIKFKAYRKSGKPMASVKIGNKINIVNLDKYESYDREINYKRELTLGNIVHFYVENKKLKAQFTLGVFSKSYPEATYFGDVYADVKYSKGKFVLKNLRFKEDTE